MREEVQVPVGRRRERLSGQPEVGSEGREQPERDGMMEVSPCAGNRGGIHAKDQCAYGTFVEGKHPRPGLPGPTTREADSEEPRDLVAPREAHPDGQTGRGTASPTYASAYVVVGGHTGSNRA